MSGKVFDEELHAHFITFSCYRRRRLLDHNAAKQIVLDTLMAQLQKQEGLCHGFVVMPDHVHALIWFPQSGQVSSFMKHWKQTSSFHIKRLFRKALTGYSASIDPRDPVWQPGFYDFNVYSDRVLEQKLNYIHTNPVRAGLVASACDWAYSSARDYGAEEAVGKSIVTEL